MNWRRVAEMLRLRDAVRLMDERVAHRRQLEDLAAEQRDQAVAVAEMKNQARLGSYSRVRIGR